MSSAFSADPEATSTRAAGFSRPSAETRNFQQQFPPSVSTVTYFYIIVV